VTPWAGMRFGRYELVAREGAGGMGEVWRARDHELRREVAVKFLPERFAKDAVRLGRFTQEALAASRLNHPNIVTIHDTGEAEGLPYIVMELVDGHTLRELLSEGRALPLRRALDIGAQVADGLAKAHAAGIVHRDLKPENVMVTRDGFVKILDFGLAKLRVADSAPGGELADSGADTWPDAPSPQTAAGALLGTVGYMSPEQARSRPVDYRSDQFALGAMLYELVTGRQAFRRETAAQTLAAIIEDAPPPIASLAPQVPAALRWLVENRCLAKEPAERYQSTRDLARELRDLRERTFESGSSEPGRPGGVGGRLRRRGTWVAAAALLGVVLWWLAPPLLRRARLALGLERIPAEKRIVVLPFAAPSGSPEDRATGYGVVYLLTARLAALERFQRTLWVEPPASVMQSGVTSAPAAGRALGASLAVTGSIQRPAGGGMVLTAALEDTGGRTLRAVTAGSLDDLADAVVRMLDLALDQPAREAFRATASGVAEASAMTAEARGYAAYADGRAALEGYDQQHSLERAISIFQRALERDPGYALAYAGLGEANWRLYQLTREATRVELAQRACERALSLNDLLAPVYVSLGVIRAGTGQAAAALQDFDRALALDPASSDALREKSLALDRLGRVAEAEAALRRAVQLRPDYWSNHNYLGAHYWRHGRYPEAEREFRRVIEIAPDNGRGLTNLGALLNARGRPEEAVAVLQRALALRPTYAAASNLALVEFDRGRYDAAARAYEQALGLDDRDYRTWRNLAIARYFSPGQRAQAGEAFERAARLATERLQVQPDDAAVLADLADCQAHLGHREKSRASLRRALALASQDVEVLATAASVYEQLGDRHAALGVLNEALSRGYPAALVEKDPGLAELRGDPRFRHGQPTGAAAADGKVRS